MTKVSFKRDRLTKITYAQIAAMSWFIFGLGPALVLLRDDFGVTRTVIAFHSVASSIGSILAGLTSTLLIHKFGRGNLIRGGAIGMVIGLLLFTGGQSIGFTLLGIFICGYSGILIIQCNSAFLNVHHGKTAPSVLSEVNALGATVGFLSPIILGLGIAVGFGWRIGFGSCVIAFIAVEVVRGRNTNAFGSPKDENSAHEHDKPGALPKLFWSAWLALACTTAIEASVLTWGSELLKTQSGLQTSTATAAVGTIVLGIGIGRFVAARLMQTRDVEKLYRQSLFISLICFLFMWQGRNSIVQLTALGLMGLIMSVHFPLGFTRLMRASVGRPDKASALSSIGSGSAAGFVPFIVGATADATGILFAFAIPAIFLIAAFGLAIRNPVPVDHEPLTEIGL